MSVMKRGVHILVGHGTSVGGLCTSIEEVGRVSWTANLVLKMRLSIRSKGKTITVWTYLDPENRLGHRS